MPVLSPPLRSAASAEADFCVVVESAECDAPTGGACAPLVNDIVLLLKPSRSPRSESGSKPSSADAAWVGLLPLSLCPSVSDAHDLDSAAVSSSAMAPASYDGILRAHCWSKASAAEELATPGPIAEICCTLDDEPSSSVRSLLLPPRFFWALVGVSDHRTCIMVLVPS